VTRSDISGVSQPFSMLDQQVYGHCVKCGGFIRYWNIYFEATFTKEVLAMINVNTSVRKPIGVIGFFLPREQTMYNLI